MIRHRHRSLRQKSVLYLCLKSDGFSIIWCLRRVCILLHPHFKTNNLLGSLQLLPVWSCWFVHVVDWHLRFGQEALLCVSVVWNFISNQNKKLARGGTY